MSYSFGSIVSQILVRTGNRGWFLEDTQNWLILNHHALKFCAKLFGLCIQVNVELGLNFYIIIAMICCVWFNAVKWWCHGGIVWRLPIAVCNLQRETCFLRHMPEVFPFAMCCHLLLRTLTQKLASIFWVIGDCNQERSNWYFTPIRYRLLRCDLPAIFKCDLVQVMWLLIVGSTYQHQIDWILYSCYLAIELEI